MRTAPTPHPHRTHTAPTTDPPQPQPPHSLRTHCTHRNHGLYRGNRTHGPFLSPIKSAQGTVARRLQDKLTLPTGTSSARRR